MKKPFSNFLLGLGFLTLTSFNTLGNDTEFKVDEHCEETAAELYESYSQYYNKAEAYSKSNDYYQDCIGWETEIQEVELD
ncbi:MULTISPECIES: hypothetical protein [unclassified Leeuwenhoekiella]|uniref:hypothetical protein n=1 Tax=unclassified Leeuwenhoekiella TaxID=2615029 RepID=UPI000C5BEE19|nr:MULTISPECIES: hypothetical protein [unclassified Leeuwenhoekiella]MAW94450.1 hypothetical protein [Leeuwenhoekiella sp.]MBA81128.1 hypothetical protein [Leeuwenhoekiella sp.]|tara:strand:+ start:56877 stop:57116 length:240 start_codon:yes stop_codon:yes gene_type:complete